MATAPVTAKPIPKAFRVEVRPNDDGTIDEVLLYDGDRCLFHLEQLDDDLYWFGMYPTDDHTEDRNFNVARRKKLVEVTER